ncbi:hypothetical protein MSG28_015794 [Choristoneura fumiferana]|uniref:Uncharacterized protein n=1 Tax=Choristoneura fumiferana TaxID=7141 RepID=A0ACC0KBZ5_CHOFU|nr:hypothetical protein MSG28_015794 [Choristoneura fumiferana]
MCARRLTPVRTHPPHAHTDNLRRFKFSLVKAALPSAPYVIGNSSVARELCYTARKLEAKEALALGLVGKVYKDRDTALTAVLELAETIALKSPVAVQTTKQNLVYSQSRTNDEGLEHIRNLNQAMLLSEDLSKSAVAAISKEQAEFENY